MANFAQLRKTLIMRTFFQNAYSIHRITLFRILLKYMTSIFLTKLSNTKRLPRFNVAAVVIFEFGSFLMD